MAAVILSDILPALPGPDFPPRDASPIEHLAWCERFALYCVQQARLARDFGLPMHKWLRAAELSTFAAEVWRERAKAGTP
jgi:hypothetical protein